MDFGYGDGVDGVFKFVDNAEVLAVFFPKFGQSIVVDIRPKDDIPPLVKVLPMARSISERLRTIRRLRPELPRPQDIIAIPWIGYVDVLKESGLWDRVVARVEHSGFDEAVKQIHESFGEIQRLERKELAHLILGEHYETIWTRPTS